MPHLSLSLLGTFQATLDDKPVTGFGTNKSRALLAYLAVELDRPHTRETLAGLLWPDFSDRAALSNLRYTLSNLRQAIGDHQANPPFLLVARDTIQFNIASDHSLDLTSFQNLSGLTDTDHLAQAVSVYRGKFLDGFFCDSAPIEEWVVLKREQIGQQVLYALRRLTTYHAARGEYDQALICARNHIALEPWDEQAYQQLMRALAFSGRRSEALSEYETCRRRLKQELGVEPASETVALYESIRDGTLREDTRALPTNVPIPLTSFVGREHEIAEVKRLLMDEKSPRGSIHLSPFRLLTLTGAGGCGKTRLASEIARGLANANHFKDGVWWVDLAVLGDPAQVPLAVTSALGLRDSPDVPIIRVITGHLRAKVALLVLDNCEHLIEACAWLSETLLSTCPNLQILATSRETLGIAGERVWRVPSLTLPDAERLPPVDQLAQYDAVQLFVERAVPLVPNWKLAENAAAVTQICARLDGIPLAIELAASRLRVLSAQEIAARLDNCFDWLSGGSRTALPRHQTLRATMDWSYDLLSEAERALLRRLSVFSGSFSLEAAEQLTGDVFRATKDELDAERYSPCDTLDLLTALVDKSLVVAVPKGDTTRYRLLETVRQYAREKLEQAGEAESVRTRHLEFFVKFAEAAEPRLRRKEQDIWLDRLELEHDNLRAALAWSLDGGSVTQGLSLAAALKEFWHLRGYLTEGREWLERMLASDTGAPAYARAKAIIQSGSLALQLGEISQARVRGEESLVLYRELGNDHGIAYSLLLLGIASHFQRNDEQSAVLLHDSLSLFQNIDDRFGCASALLWIARGRMRQGDHPQAAALLEESLSLLRALGDKESISFALGSLGDLARHQGDCMRAADLRKESLRMAWAVGSKGEVCYALEQLALIAIANREPTRAVTLWGAAEILRESLGRSPAPSYEAEYAQAVADARSRLGEEKFAAAWTDGQGMTWDQAVEYALENLKSG